MGRRNNFNKLILWDGPSYVPPYVVPSVPAISGLVYEVGNGPSAGSSTFRILAAGLKPASGNITVTPSANIEVYDGSTWQSAPFTVAYTLGSIITPSIYRVRLIAGLPVAGYTETVTFSAGNAPNYVMPVTGAVTIPMTIVATGGTITRDGDYLVHTFTGDGTFDVSQVGSFYNTVEYLVVAGGGGAGTSGAGGAGGYRTAAGLSVAIQSYSVVIGAGGAGSAAEHAPAADADRGGPVDRCRLHRQYRRS